ncbi:fimbrial biogenesis chaperone [Pinirhizobacter soli]|uniref:fimbrial biogenesis chaperone n=1 Tax=Pinirhizobacter soli TaxID=2786953 RepID=UPI002029F9C3|nr:fimbria/pilus periplasmic chaperone [Pinirhizobacter soli]
MTSKMRHAIAALALFAGMFSGAGQASVVIGGTRVVYPAQDKEVTIKLTNEGAKPAIVQVWLDDGDEKSTPDTAKVPFTVSPPIFRMDPDKGQSVRVMYTQEALAKDKETLFWVNVLEVPPKAAASASGESNMLQFAFRTRIKMFFRPQGLAGNVTDAPDKLTWKLKPAANGKGMAVEVSNPTPYHVNFTRVAVQSGDKEVASADGGMVAPGSSTDFAMSALSAKPAHAKVAFSIITDYGAVTPMTALLNP